MGVCEIVPFAATIGAEVRGLDLRSPTDDDVAAIAATLFDRGVVVFRGQHIDDRAQRDLAARLGPVQRFAFGSPVDEAIPEVHAIATGGPGPKVGNADTWHADATFMAEPPLATVLRIVTLPRVGGDTVFADARAAYDALSAPMRRLVDGLTATHDVAKSSSHRAELHARFPPVSHPVVAAHPVTGRRALYVNRIFTRELDGLSERENDTLLRWLCDHVRSPDFQVRIRWAPGTVVAWDNRSVQHYAVHDYAEPRVVHRVVVDGEAPIGP